MKQKEYSQSPLYFHEPYKSYALTIIAGLYQIPRTGWVDRGVKNPETVGEHIDDLVIWAKLFPEIIGLDKMLKVHDWVEWDPKVGDLRTDPNCPADHRVTKEEKKARELEAMKKICRNLGPYGKFTFSIWWEYEEGKTERAQISFQLNKLHPILKAIFYHKNGEPSCPQEFIDYNGPFIVNPKLKGILDNAISKM